MVNVTSSILPVHNYRKAFFNLSTERDTIVTAPTGTGKSTTLPCWLRELHQRILVIEPRRIACRALSDHVAMLNPDQRVGYTIRGFSNADSTTDIHFVTPGIALQLLERSRLAETCQHYGAIMLDEFHQRSWETDLILALLAQFPQRPRLLITSATLDPTSIQSFLEADHLAIQGNWYPVTIHHVEQRTAMPSLRLVEERLQALWHRIDHRSSHGSILIFLPGIAAIEAVSKLLQGQTQRTIVKLHSSLPQETPKAFQPGKKIILATNIAESSLTIPDVTVVIDSGLSKQLHYRNGHVVLTTVPITLDAATQRTGRAGRTQPGTCYRLWGSQANLEPHLSPEIQRVDLKDCAYRLFRLGYDPNTITYYEPPRTFALQEAITFLQRSGLLDPKTQQVLLPQWALDLPIPLSVLRLFASPNTQWLGYALAIAAILQHHHRPLPPKSSPALLEARSNRFGPSNLLHNIRVLGQPDRQQLGLQADRYANVLDSWRELTQRKSDKVQLPLPAFEQLDWPRLLFGFADMIFGKRPKRQAWTNDKIELKIQDDSFPEQKYRYCLIPYYRTVEGRGRQVQLFSDTVIPLHNHWIQQSGLGDWQLSSVATGQDVLTGTFHKLFRGHQLTEEQRVLQGSELTQGIILGIAQGTLFPRLIQQQQREIDYALLSEPWSKQWTEQPDPLQVVTEKVHSLALDEPEEFSLLSDDELITRYLQDAYLREKIEAEFPTQIEAQGALFSVELQVRKRQLFFHWVSGSKNVKIPLFKLPKARGWSIWQIERGKKRKLRG